MDTPQQQLENIHRAILKYKDERIAGYTQLAQKLVEADYTVEDAFKMASQFIEHASYVHREWADLIPIPPSIQAVKDALEKQVAEAAPTEQDELHKVATVPRELKDGIEAMRNNAPDAPPVDNI